MKSRFGCLVSLLLVAAVVAPTVWFAADPGKSSAMAVAGFLALAFIYANSGAEWVASKGKRTPQPPPDGDG